MPLLVYKSTASDCRCAYSYRPAFGPHISTTACADDAMARASLSAIEKPLLAEAPLLLDAASLVVENASGTSSSGCTNSRLPEPQQAASQEGRVGPPK